MRAGVLADTNAERQFAPMTQTDHDILFIKPHVQRHKMHTKKARSDRYRPATRPRFPVMALHEYGQLLNPLNARPFVEAHGQLIEASKTHVPPPDFDIAVQTFNEEHPNFSTERGMNKETAFFIEKLASLGYDVIPEHYFTGTNAYGQFIKTNVMKRPLSDFYERLHDRVLRKSEPDVELLKTLKTAYDDAMEHVVPPYSGKAGYEDFSASASSSRFSESSGGQSLRASPDRDRDRSPQAKRGPRASPGRSSQPRVLDVVAEDEDD